MSRYLFKEEPSSYSYDEFAKDGHVTWTGVKNPVAQKNLRSVKKGDDVTLVGFGTFTRSKRKARSSPACRRAFPEFPS